MAVDPPVFLIGVGKGEEMLGDYVLSESPLPGRKWGVSLTGPTELLLRKMGLRTLARLSVGDREATRKLHEMTLDRILATIRSLNPVPDFVLIADDCASYDGPLLPKWYMEELYLGSHESLVDEIRSIGSAAFLHADGNYGPYFEEMGSAWDLIHPLDVHPRGDLADYRSWLRAVAKLRSKIKSMIATGIAFELNNEELIVRAVKEFLELDLRDIVLSNFHPPLKELDVRMVLGMIRDALP